MNECCKQTYVASLKEVVILINTHLAHMSIGSLTAALNFAIKELEKKK
jgi:hypothetical protein